MQKLCSQLIGRARCLLMQNRMEQRRNPKLLESFTTAQVRNGFCLPPCDLIKMGSLWSTMALLKITVPKAQLQEALVKTPAKKWPMVLRMLALASAMIFSVCIFSVLVKRPETHSETHVVRNALPITMAFNLSKNSSTLLNLSYIAEESLAGKRVPLIQKRVNFTLVGLFSEVRVDTKEKNLSQVVTINSTEKPSSTETRLNLTEKQSLDLKFRQPLSVNYNKTATNYRKVQKCMPVSLYAIVSMQRSGSKWFEALLNSHENIRSHGEIFYNFDRKCNMTVITTVLDRVYSLNWNVSTFRRKRNKCLAAVGFKWMVNQGIRDNHEGIVDYFNRRGISAILLLRKNLLRRLVSVKANKQDGHDNLLNGTHKAHVSSKEEAQILASYKPKLDVKRLIPNLEHMERLAADTLEYFKSTRHIVVYYEDLVQNQTEKMMDVLEFLRAPQRSLVSGHGIQDNHEEIVDYFNRNGVSAILLLRRNHLQPLTQILATYRPELNVKSLIPTLEHMEKLAADTLEYFKSTRHNVVYYEDLVGNQTKKMMEVLEFIRVPQRSLVSGDVKIHTSPMAQQIANWRAVFKVITRSKFKRLIARTTKSS
ncbi:hypothetical protein HPP92_009376 [Vanilla planifolia]|uniref:Sulfotransferase n=1 Tax=Vanilla planifolia TaxID=51239 RepID=A0A835RFK5_VANPL|nr:hypothetical protein HPP92_009376 [Vanilla planifolia]